MKEKKKMSLAMQIFIALVLAIIAGLLMQNYADFATIPTLNHSERFS